MAASAPLPEDHPMRVAWEEFSKSEECANAVRWATKDRHTSGALWTAFVAGYEAAKKENNNG